MNDSSLPQVHGLWPMFDAEATSDHLFTMRWAAVRLDRDTPDFAHLLHQWVMVDRVLYVCLSVERFLHAPPWLAGERIGLFLEPL